MKWTFDAHNAAIRAANQAQTDLQRALDAREYGRADIDVSAFRERYETAKAALNRSYSAMRGEAADARAAFGMV